MNITALVSDYDGTLALDGSVDDRTLSAVERLRDSGRKFILATGRELDELLTVFPCVTLCDAVVAENGALLYHPSTREEKFLGIQPPGGLVRLLRDRGVHSLSVGRSLLATRAPHEEIVRRTIADLGLPWRVILNRDSLMILPPGIDKAAGLHEALHMLGLSPGDAAGIGDAENDRDFLAVVGYSACVDNALPSLKEACDVVTSASHGAGVAEFIEDILVSDRREGGGKTMRRRKPGR